MRSIHVVGSLNPDVALPGTSAALTARTIDATVHPVAQVGNAVSEVPRLIDSIPPQLVGGALGLTGVVLMLSLQRYRLSLSPVLLAGMLMMPVSNYRADGRPAKARVETPAVEKKRVPAPEWFDPPSRAAEPVPPPDVPRSFPRIPFPDFDVPDINVNISPELIDEAMPLIELVVPEDWDREDISRYLRHNSERLRREVKRLRQQQLREERRHAQAERRRANSMEYHYSR